MEAGCLRRNLGRVCRYGVRLRFGLVVFEKEDESKGGRRMSKTGGAFCIGGTPRHVLKEGTLLFSGREVVAATKKPQVFRPVALSI